jgi:hypothetical protein
MNNHINQTARLYQRAEEFTKLAEHSFDPTIAERYRSAASGCVKLAECEEEIELKVTSTSSVALGTIALLPPDRSPRRRAIDTATEDLKI